MNKTINDINWEQMIFVGKKYQWKGKKLQVNFPFIIFTSKPEPSIFWCEIWAPKMGHYASPLLGTQDGTLGSPPPLGSRHPRCDTTSPPPPKKETFVSWISIDRSRSFDLQINLIFFRYPVYPAGITEMKDHWSSN